jgi:L-ascorbate metabolism protein UlaG (beta-lactamase superfamily)
MRRRSFLQAGITAATLFPSAVLAAPKSAPPKPAPADGLQIQWLGHSCFLFTSKEGRLLVNPFRPGGCTAGYRKPNVDTDLVLLSSRLLDEGALDVVKGNPRVLYQPGVYTVDKFTKLQGIRTLHDRRDGKQFGENVAWHWQQSGLDIVHLGGIASEPNDEAKILIGKPDILFIPVGGGAKSFDAEMAHDTIESMQPRLVIPTYYKTTAADAECTINGVDPFLKLFKSDVIQTLKGSTITIQPGALPKETQVRVFAYNFASKDPVQ